MLYFNRFETIFYGGVLFIIGSFVFLVTLRFKKDDKIDLKEHILLLIVYIILLIGFIYLWRIVYETFFASELLKLLQKDEIQGL